VSHNTQSNDLTHHEANAAIGVQAFITVPFFKAGQWKYLFSVHDDRPRVWYPDQIELVQAVAERSFPRIDRTIAELSLQKNEELLRLAMAGAQAGSWDWVPATGKLTWSSEIFDLYGLDPTQSELDYNTWSQTCVHPEDRPWINQALAEIIASGQTSFHLEFRILHPQRGVRWILGLGQLIVHDPKETLRLRGINLDISDRNRQNWPYGNKFNRSTCSPRLPKTFANPWI
jgi:PAS domain-containing protein